MRGLGRWSGPVGRARESLIGHAYGLPPSVPALWLSGEYGEIPGDLNRLRPIRCFRLGPLHRIGVSVKSSKSFGWRMTVPPTEAFQASHSYAVNCSPDEFASVGHQGERRLCTKTCGHSRS